MIKQSQVIIKALNKSSRNQSSSLLFEPAKGHLISKANCQAVNSSKKRTNEFVFTTMRHVFVRVLEEIEDKKKDISKLTDL